MMPIAHAVEQTYKLLVPYGMSVLQLTPSRIRLLSCSRTFNCSKAKDRLGYTLIVSLQDGLERTIGFYTHLRAEHQRKRDGPSKVSIYLGNGRTADILLWKERKQTVSAILVLIAIYYNFIATGYTMITAVSKFLSVASIFLFVHVNLPGKMLGYKIEKIPLLRFHLSEEMSHRVALLVASSWNNAVGVLKSLCMGNDWILFLKVLELGIVVHSVIIGISLGASGSPKTVKPLVAALTFHQFFEGMGLGGCITQAKFKSKAIVIMVLFFSLTTPVGIGIGIGISNGYDENSPTALIVEGIFNAASAGILIYMSLVDLLAADFMSVKMQTNRKLQIGANISLLFGAGCMSLLAKWA